MTTSLMKRADAARYVTETTGRPVSASALSRLAHLGRGPRYAELLGHAVYRREDLDAWVEQELARPTGAPRRRGGRTARAAAAA